ncbi:PucR family transcriptional regulator [Caenibacillus caldisaponilyticus]|uniref:PucR family transcriptional regulator n=1 Tax=Caenibacillus caldisaponilyticus TaxID=1674942 RepID=UPI00098883B2|nr:helix-turn-helix domain-containing protein [Caenibacillus caldisaponilyticus]
MKRETMLNQLKNLYGDAFLATDGDRSEADADDFYWFYAENGVRFGVKKAAMTDRERALLALRFRPAHPPLRLYTRAERFWHGLLFEGLTAERLDHANNAPYFLLHIALKKPIADAEGFREAIGGLISKEPVLLWKDEGTAVLVLNERPEKAIVQEVVDLLVTDFYIDVAAFIGGPLAIDERAKARYDLEAAVFRLARRLHPQEQVFTFAQAAPLYALECGTQAIESIFQPLFAVLDEEDAEMEKSLLAYFEHGMNSSTAAKALYIHRNSLLYRLDRFSEKTGLDPKNFKDAVYIYLGILMHRLRKQR